jgi:hypothetical protein
VKNVQPSHWSAAGVAYEPPEAPDAVLVTTTDALLTAFGDDDLAELVAADAVIIGDPEVVRHLVANVRVPTATYQYPMAPPANAVARPDAVRKVT